MSSRKGPNVFIQKLECAQYYSIDFRPAGPLVRNGNDLECGRHTSDGNENWTKTHPKRHASIGGFRYSGAAPEWIRLAERFQDAVGGYVQERNRTRGRRMLDKPAMNATGQKIGDAERPFETSNEAAASLLAPCGLP